MLNNVRKYILIRDSVLAVAIKLIGATLGLAINWLLIRQVGAKEAGYYYLSLSYIALLRPLMEFGFNSLILKSENVVDERLNKVKKLTLASINSVFVFILFYVIYFCYIRAYYLPYEVTKLVDYLLPSYYIIVVVGFISFFYQSEGKTFISSILVEPAYQFIFAIFLVYSHVASNANVGLFSLLSSVIVFVISIRFLLTTVKKNNMEMVLYFPSIGEIKHLLGEAIPILGISIIASLSNNLFLIILGEFAPSDDITLYSLSLRISIIISFILICVSKVVSPNISRLYSDSRFCDLENYVRKATILSFCSSLLIGTTIIFFSPYILSFFDRSLGGGHIILTILCLGQIVNSMTGPVASVLIMTGFSRIVRNVSFFNLVVSIFSAYIFIPDYGLYAAACLFSGSMIFQNITCYVIMVKKLRINPIVRRGQ